MGDTPESWNALLEKREMFIGQERTLRRLVNVLEDRIDVANKSHASVKLKVVEIEEALMSLGWMPEKAEA